MTGIQSGLRSQFWGLLAAGLTTAMTVLAALCLTASAAPDFPALSGRIVDQAGLLSASDIAALTSELQELEKKSSDQLVIVTLPTLQGYPIEDFGYQLARHWGIGQAGTDNGVVLIVAPNERKVRIEVGRGLEPILTDTLAKLVIENSILPRFRRGEFAAGIRAGATDIADIMLGDAEEVQNRLARFKPKSDVDVEGLIVMTIWIAFILFVIWRSQQQAKNGPRGPGSGVGRRRKSNNDWIIIPGPGGRGGSGGWSGGSSGGFSGGGGGFGGGGASGGW